MRRSGLSRVAGWIGSSRNLWHIWAMFGWRSCTLGIPGEMWKPLSERWSSRGRSRLRWGSRWGLTFFLRWTSSTLCLVLTSSTIILDFNVSMRNCDRKILLLWTMAHMGRHQGMRQDFGWLLIKRWSFENCQWPYYWSGRWLKKEQSFCSNWTAILTGWQSKIIWLSSSWPPW